MLGFYNDFCKNWRYLYHTTLWVFKVYTTVFWFSITAFSNNIYTITVKQVSQLLFIWDNFVFVKKCYTLIFHETFICKKSLDKIPKALIGCETFLREIFAGTFSYIFSQTYTNIYLLFICYLFSFEGLFCILFFSLVWVQITFCSCSSTKGASLPLTIFVFSRAWTKRETHIIALAVFTRQVFCQD